MKDLETISYEEGFIYNDEGKARLWKDHNIIYLNGIHAFKLTPRNYEIGGQKVSSSLITIYTEDDSTLYETDLSFDTAWLPDLLLLIGEALKKIPKLNK